MLDKIKDFTFQSPFSEKSRLISEEIKQLNSVSIHVRRTDYISNIPANNYHGTCNETYYIEAMKIIGKKISNPHFYIFSDEPEWFKANIKTNFQVTFVEHNKNEKSFEDMYLMSLCKHNIIANSSFSWWGAWLNSNENKQVIAPANWFQDKTKNTKDLLPETWIKL